MYKKGDWYVQCDMCGRKRYASECRMNSDNLFVCLDTCWEPRHPQESVRAVPEKQTVPIHRPMPDYNMGSTTVKVTAAKDATSIDISSISGLSQYDELGIEMDNGATHWSYITTAPSGDTIVLNDGLPYGATAGNDVYTPSVNNYSWEA